jgi:hypothetical protein
MAAVLSARSSTTQAVNKLVILTKGLKNQKRAGQDRHQPPPQTKQQDIPDGLDQLVESGKLAGSSAAQVVGCDADCQLHSREQQDCRLIVALEKIADGNDKNIG